jgi:pimeloyl-ACP methyl ester carboxylesterase
MDQASNGPERLDLEVSPGVTLAVDAYGEPGRPPVVLLHGGGQTRHAWGGTARELAAAGFRAYAIDQRGHGESSWHEGGDYSVGAFAADVVAFARTLSAPPVLIGASLGGMASVLAEGETEGGIAKAIVLVDIGVTAQKAGVMRVLGFMQSGKDGFASLDEVADAVAAYLPHRRRPKSIEGLAKNVRLRDGRYHWHWDPKFLEGRGHEETPGRLKRAAAKITIPTLLVRGRLSDVIGDEDVAEVRRTIPHAEVVDVRDAGHMVAGDDNDVFTRVVVDFLKRG